MNKDIYGIFPAMLTPFTESGVDLDAAALHLDRMLTDGADGAFLCGSSAEMLSMSAEERMALTKVACEVAAGRGRMIVQVGHPDLRVARQLAAHAERCGAAAIAAIPPIYYAVPFASVLDWMREIAAATSLPALYYNIPASTGVTLTAEQLIKILALPGVAGMKFTANDFFALDRVADTYPAAALYNGYDEMFLAGLASGANGYIGTSGNILLPAVRRIYTAFAQGDNARARAVQSRLNRFISAAIPYGFIAVCKAVRALQGIPMGRPRTPQSIPDDTAMRVVETELFPLVEALNADCK